MDTVSKSTRSRIMSVIRSRRTKPEMKLAGALARAGMKFRMWVDSLPGKPDFVLKNDPLVIFVDGCFFHGCPRHGTIPKTNTTFWKKKIDSNCARAQLVQNLLHLRRLSVLRFWECEVKRDPSGCVDVVRDYVR